MRLLVVEDEPALAAAVASGLRREGYVVDVAIDGVAAQQALTIDRYDLVVLDVTLPRPGPDGHELCAKVRNGEFGDRHTRVLMATARDSIAERVAGLDQGADDYLVKPFALDELRARVRCLLRRPPTDGSSVIALGPLTVDLVGRRVWCHGHEAGLTPKEYSVLRFLAVRPDAVVSQEELLHRVWDSNADPFTETVRVTVGAVRRKLAALTREVTIETVVGVGYRLRCATAGDDR